MDKYDSEPSAVPLIAMAKKDPRSFNYHDLHLKMVLCELCGSRVHRELFVGDRYSMGLRTVMCEACSLVFTNPRPSKDDMAEFYRSHYRKFYESTLVPDQAYIQKGEFEFRAQVVFSHLEPFIKKALVSRRTIRVLDIGCSEGSILRLLKSKLPGVLIAVGIEPSVEFAKFAENYANAEIFVGSLKEFVASRRFETPFDFIIVNHVLEHFSNPSQQLALIRQLLAYDGILFIEVPDILGVWAGSSMIHIAHMFQFSEQTLRSVLTKSGFSPLSLKKEGNHLHPWAMTAISCKGEYQDVALPNAQQVNEDFRVIREKFSEQNSQPIAPPNRSGFFRYCLDKLRIG